MRYLFILTIIIISLHTHAQYSWDIGVNTGFSNYLGEMGGEDGTRRDFINDMKLSRTGFSTGVFIRYKATPDFSFRTSFNYGRISGDDKLSSNPARNARNLNFRNDIFEVSAEAEYYFITINDLGHTYRFQNNFRTYVSIGLAGFFHNPKALYNNEWIPLRPLRTEGQSKPYSKFGLSIPLSAGFYFTLSKKYRIGWEISWRTTFTDYLDDVSTTYADPEVLPDKISAELSNRTDEINVDPVFAANFTPGSKRGDPAHNDTYVFSAVKLSYVIRGMSNWKKPQYSFRDRIKIKTRKKLRPKY